jgi:hypothetical protein
VECLDFVPFCSVPFLFPTLAFVCSYMVLHAQPARMFAQVSFISDFLGDADLIELTGFYLTSLTVCTCRLMVLAASWFLQPPRPRARAQSPLPHAPLQSCVCG